MNYAKVPSAVAASSLLCVLPADGNVQRGAEPRFQIGVVASHYDSRMEPVFPMAFGSRVAKAGLDRLRNLPDIPRVLDGAEVIGIAGGHDGAEGNVAAREGLELLVTDVQLPALDLLKEAHGQDHV